MLQFLAASVFICGLLLLAEEPATFKLAAPEGWGGETIALPPGFAPGMKLKGSEHIRFAPGIMRPETDSFFSYAFVFELQAKPVLTDAVLKEEFLTYYRGLCTAVLGGKRPDVDVAKFTLELKREKVDVVPARYTGTLDWVEPFATKKPQKLNLEVTTWTKGERNFIFACVSPQPADAAIWKQLRAIRDDYTK